MAAYEPPRLRPMNLVVQVNDIVLTAEEAASVLTIARRMNAAEISLYKTSEGLKAVVIEHSGARHPDVPISE